MDLPKVYFKRHQKMGPYVPQPCSTQYYGTMPPFGDFSTAFNSLHKNCDSMPQKSFSYPNCFTNFKLMQEKIINNPFGFMKEMPKLDNLPTMSLTCIVGGLVDGREGVWKAAEQGPGYSNPLENMLNQLVSKSVEITRTMSCPDPFNICDFTPSKGPCQAPDPLGQECQKPSPKMSYADVTKINLSNLKRHDIPEFSNDVPSHNSSLIDTVKKNFKVSPLQPVKSGFVNIRKNGTNHSNRVDKDGSKHKFHPCTKASNSRRPQNKRGHLSIKRELGTKRNNQNMDLDGSIWCRDYCDMDICEEASVCSPCSPSLLLRVRSISTDSECSSEQSECVRNPRVRSLSECSVNSLDSDDSFIVFECDDDFNPLEESCDDECSSDDDEGVTVVDSCNGVLPADYLQCVNDGWLKICSVEKIPDPAERKKTCIFSSNPILKKVRFACGEALAKVRKLCAWDYAHRAARIGPWEQAARDRARFSSRIASLAPVLDPIFDPTHRKQVYHQRFEPR